MGLISDLVIVMGSSIFLRNSSVKKPLLIVSVVSQVGNDLSIGNCLKKS